MNAIRKIGGIGRRPLCLGALALAPAAKPRTFSRQLFGGARPARASQPYILMPFSGDDGQVSAPRGARGRVRSRQWRRRPGVLRADLRRTLFPGHRIGNAEPRPPSCNSFCPASKPRCSPAPISTTLPPTTASPIPTCRTRSAFATNSSAAAPATARTRSVSPVKIEKDPTLRKGDIVAGEERPSGRGPQRRPPRRRS